MTGTKQILLAGFAALCMVLPACQSETHVENAEMPPLVASHSPLATVSYLAEYTQDGSVPFTCEVKLGTDGRIRRDYIWKDEKDADKKVSIVIDGGKAVRIEDGKAVPVKDAEIAQARFFAGLILAPDSVVSNAGKDRKAGKTSGSEEDAIVPYHAYALEMGDLPDMESCVVLTDPKSDRWSSLIIRMADDPDTVFSTRFHEYRSESGFIFPSRIVSSTDGGAPVTCTIRDVKINPELPDELFRLPDTNG